MRTLDGLIVGNIEDKSALRNPVARALVRGFDNAITALVGQVAPRDIHEIGCGGGRLTALLAAQCAGSVRGTDLTADLFPPAAQTPPNVTFSTRSIYALDPAEDSADLLVCCEVLEHLERPDDALAAIRRLQSRAVLLSVPREPIWRVLNVMRGKYLGALGNTPGHLNHWSTRAFTDLLRLHHFEVLAVRRPLPWTMVLARATR